MFANLAFFAVGVLVGSHHFWPSLAGRFRDLAARFRPRIIPSKIVERDF